MRQIILSVVFLAFVANVVWAQETLTYHGELSDAAGQPITASYAMVFALYASEDEATPLWTETYDSITIVDGRFTVDLGLITALGSEVAATPNLFLGIRVNDGNEMAPRMKVSSVLRSQWSAHAADVYGEDINPKSVTISGIEVINASGQWVGEPAGLVGLTGPPGIQGPDGNDGADGAVGPQGPPGNNGADGAAGPQGPPGNDGADGAVGPQGPRGNNGADGAVGAVGPQGPPGPAGNAASAFVGTCTAFASPGNQIQCKCNGGETLMVLSGWRFRTNPDGSRPDCTVINQGTPNVIGVSACEDDGCNCQCTFTCLQ